MYTLSRKTDRASSRKYQVSQKKKKSNEDGMAQY